MKEALLAGVPVALFNLLTLEFLSMHSWSVGLKTNSHFTFSAFF